jgi:3',5'-cyclic AMP phosphodiesterase CpdA
MFRKRLPSGISLLFLLSLLVLSLSLINAVFASDPHSAYYSSENGNLFWFIHTSDTHIGASGTQDSQNLQWIVTQGKNIINPNFIVVTGDLTDSTNGNFLGWPNGPYQAEWDQYSNILSNNVDSSFYYDIPGNHDAYNDGDFSYYRANSIQGRATGNAQVSWTRDFPFGKYHFLGINTADNTGASFSLTWPYGDYAGLDTNELAFISQELQLHSDAHLTLIFGHHPLVSTGNSTDTYVYYGANEFMDLMDAYHSSLYGYGHLHSFGEDFFTQNMSEGVFYFHVASLGKSNENQFSVTAIDCNGISTVTQTINTWPIVLITAPLDRYLGNRVNPYSYTVPNSTSNPIRTLVFDPSPVQGVQYRVDGGTTWQQMSNVSTNPLVWEAAWDASTLAEGEHTIEVQAATASGIRSNIITVYVERQQLPLAGVVDAPVIGKYVITGTKKNKVTTFLQTSTFKQGEGVVIRANVIDVKTQAPLSNATVQITISGPQTLVLTSSPISSNGTAEVQWNTSAPNRRGVGGTLPGSYTATVTNVSASGYSWDGTRADVDFTLELK